MVRVSEPLTRERRKIKAGFYNLNCEVFDSDSFAWKRLNDLELPRDEFVKRYDNPVSSYGFLHWLTTGDNVIRFCMRTETWSLFPIPDDLVGVGSLVLVSYEGKLGVLHSRSGDRYDLWVLEKSLEKSWLQVTNLKLTGLEICDAEHIWFPSNDVITLTGFGGRLCLYNMSNNKSQYVHVRARKFYPYYNSDVKFFPFYSNYDRVDCLDKDHSSERKTKNEEGCANIEQGP